MANLFEDVAAQARQLSTSEQARLIEELLRTLANEGGDDPAAVTEAWEAEIERRLDEAEAGRVEWLSHEQVMSQARAAVAAVVRPR